MRIRKKIIFKNKE